MANRTFALETLGCKVNQYESSYFTETLAGAGYRPVSFRQQADIYLVHSCAVTGKAAFQTRQLLRRARRLNPAATIVAAGCAAQVEPDRFGTERLATHILGSAEKFDLLDWLEHPGSLAVPCRAVSDARSHGPFRCIPVHHMAAARTRAFLKIQDGCDSFCSYCIVPYSRGRSRSLPLDQVHAQVDRFRDAGHQEIVLSGIHLGQWGKDLQPARTLLDLLVSLQGKAPPRVRLSSLETLEWDAGLIEHLARWDWICPHFHIPLQSGDAEILERMHRGYTPQMFAQLVRKLHRTFPQAALGSDVMVGFPGETQRHFRNTLELIEELPLTYLHVFPYSPRPGTEAAKWPGRVTGREIDQRAQALRELGARKRQEFQRRFLGRRLEILVEGEMNGQPGWLHGTTANYLKVAFEARGPIAPGTLAWVTVRRLSPSGLFGEMCAIPR